MEIKRRTFLASSLGALAATGVSWSANSALRVGVIGLNGRGQSHVSGFEGLDGVDVVALCDVDSNVLGRIANVLDDKTSRKAKRFRDFREMLDDRDIDAITIATPNHWHALMAVLGMDAGKDVYVEKPCSHNVAEGQKLVSAAQKHKRICQHGTQNRSSAGVKSAIDFLREGGIGKVHTAKGLCYKWRPSIGQHPDESAPAELDWNLWQGPAASHSYSKRFVHYNWHWFWSYGNGDIGNQGVHQMDVARWGLGVNQLPSGVVAVGGRFGYSDDAETPNTLSAQFEYPGAVLQFEVRGLPTNDEKGAKVGNIFYGSEGYLVLTGANWKAFAGQKDELLREHKGERGEKDEHFANFAEAVRSRDPKMLHAPPIDGHLSSALCHLANISYRTGRKLQFDPKGETFVDDNQANQMLTREYRAPFQMPTDL